MIPLAPASIAAAVPYPLSLNAVPMNIFKKPLEGAKCLSLSFAFDQNAAWQVNLFQSNTPPLSQLACLYVDNAASQHDVDIVFPDTQFSARVAFGQQQMIPCLTGTSTPVFYVSLVNGGATDPNDVTNVFAINQFLPEFVTNNYIRSLTEGFGKEFQLQPLYLQSDFFYGQNLSAAEMNAGFTIIDAQQWYITAIEGSYVAAEAAAPTGAQISLFDGNKVNPDGSSRLIQFAAFADTTPNAPYEYANLTDLNYVSSGTGPLTIKFEPPVLTQGQFYVNIAGGILVP